MLNNQINKLEYINKLESEVNRLNEENRKLKQSFLFGCQNDNILMLQLRMEIDALKRELSKAQRKNAMLVLMRQFNYTKLLNWVCCPVFLLQRRIADYEKKKSSV